MSLAVERAAETVLVVAEHPKLPADIMQKDANKLLRDTYVNDRTMGGSLGDVYPLMGHKLPHGEFPALAQKVGLKMKSMVWSGFTQTSSRQSTFSLLRMGPRVSPLTTSLLKTKLGALQAN